MKKTFLFSALSLVLAYLPYAKAEMVLGCRRPNPIVYTDYYWMEIDRSDDGKYTFYYGLGIDTQLTDVYYLSPVNRVSANNFSYQGSDYTVEVDVNGSSASFHGTGNFTSDTRNFQCVTKNF